MTRDCKLTDMEYRADLTEYWTTDKNGNPVDMRDSTDTSDFRDYVCTNCYNTFATWGEVLAHIDRACTGKPDCPNCGDLEHA